MDYNSEAKKHFNGYFYVRYEERAALKSEELAFSETMLEYNLLKIKDIELVWELEQEPDYKEKI